MNARNAQVRDIKKAVDDLVERVIFEPTVKQNDTFVAWFEAEMHGGGEYDRQHEAELLAFWGKLHPGTLPGIIRSTQTRVDVVPHVDDEIPQF